VKLTATERRGLRAYARTRSWRNVHGRTIHALERKGLLGFIRGRRDITPAGHAALVVPNIFDDLFAKKESMPEAKKKLSARGLTAKQDAALKRIRTVTDVEIDGHPLLDREQQKICKIFRDKAAKDGDAFTMLDFAKLALRATGKNYAEASEYGHTKFAVARLLVLDALHRSAALLYTYEALKRGPKIVTETIEERGTLRDIELLASHGS
jgi:hypothetical protein